MSKTIDRDTIKDIILKEYPRLELVDAMNLVEDVLYKLGYIGLNLAKDPKDFKRQNITFSLR